MDPKPGRPPIRTYGVWQDPTALDLRACAIFTMLRGFEEVVWAWWLASS
jgi:hypothetical protein